MNIYTYMYTHIYTGNGRIRRYGRAAEAQIVYCQGIGGISTREVRIDHPGKVHGYGRDGEIL